MSYTSNLSNNKREQLRSVMDDFTTFSWGYEQETGSNPNSLFNQFGVFIVGGKDALKFYNGPGFSNKYITTQYQSQNSTLQAVEFKPMTISFTMGVYWFTIEEYRKLLLLFHPYEINTLSFSFAPEWYYLVKLSSISDSTRYVLGKDEDGNYRYYTEIKLTFDVQGEPVAQRFDEYSLNTITQSHGGTVVSSNTHEDSEGVSWDKFSFHNPHSLKQTDLDTPFEFSVTMTPGAGPLYPSEVKWPNDGLYPQNKSISQQLVDQNKGYYIGLVVSFTTPRGSIKSELVFEAFLKNLSWYDTAGNPITLTYDSSQGLLFINNGNSILSGQTTVFSGKKMVEALRASVFKLPGALESGLPLSNFKDINFTLYHSNNWKIVGTNSATGNLLVNLLSRARTNIV